MASKQKESVKRKRTNLSISEKLELLTKLEDGISVAKVCEEYGVKKQSVSDIRKAKNELRSYAVKFDVDPCKDGKGVIHNRKHMKVPKSKELDEAVYKWYVQQRSVHVNIRGVEIADAAKKLARKLGINSFKGSDGWLWRFCNRHGIRNKVQHGEAASADISAVEPFRLKFNELIKKEDLQLSQIYNADETALFWCSLPKNTQAFKHEDKVPGKKISKDKFSALLGANASGNHRLKPVVVGKSAKPRCLKDCMNELPIVYYNTKNSWFNRAIFNDWFFKHFIPEVQNFQEKLLHIAPEEVKAILLIDNAPAHPNAEKLVSTDGRIRAIFLPPNTTSLIQPMDQGVIVSCKRHYQHKYLDEVLVVIEEEEDMEEDTRGQRTANNIKKYNLKSGIYNFASAWKDVKMTTLLNSWKKLMLDEDPELDFKGFEPKDFHKVLSYAGQKDVNLKDIENWLEENDADPGYQVLSVEEIAESVQAGDDSVGSSSDSEEEVVVKPKMSHVRDSIDTLLQFVDTIDNPSIQAYYQHLRTLRELIIREQYKCGKQLKLDSFFKPKPTPTVFPTPGQSTPSTSTEQIPVVAISSASEELHSFSDSE